MGAQQHIIQIISYLIIILALLVALFICAKLRWDVKKEKKEEVLKEEKEELIELLLTRASLFREEAEVLVSGMDPDKVRQSLKELR